MEMSAGVSYRAGEHHAVVRSWASLGESRRGGSRVSQ